MMMTITLTLHVLSLGSPGLPYARHNSLVSVILQGLVTKDQLSYLDLMETKLPTFKEMCLHLILCFFYGAIRMPRFTHFGIPN